MVCLKKEEILGSALRDARPRQPANQRPISAALAESVLTDCRMDSRQRAGQAVALLREAIAARGGTLEVREGPCGVRVQGEVRVSAGRPVSSAMVRAGVEGKTSAIVIEREGTVDEKVVDAVRGYGGGALDVAYRVSGEESHYVIRTNGSQACLESRLVDVALALAGAAEIVEDMLGRSRASRASEPKEPVQPPQAVRNAA